jgi:hypothetical protein
MEEVEVVGREGIVNPVKFSNPPRVHASRHET